MLLKHRIFSIVLFAVVGCKPSGLTKNLETAEFHRKEIVVKDFGNSESLARFAEGKYFYVLGYSKNCQSCSKYINFMLIDSVHSKEKCSIVSVSGILKDYSAKNSRLMIINSIHRTPKVVNCAKFF